MQTILVPIDFSDSDVRTAEYAIHFATQTSASKVILFRAIENYFESNAEMNTIDLEEEFYNHVIKDEEKELQSFRSKLPANDVAVTIETICQTTRLSESINDICKDYNVDVIIVSRVSNDALTESLFGNNVIELAEESITPLIIVPPDVVLDPLKEILFACNFNNKNESAPSSAIQTLLEATKAKIFVLHVEENNDNSNLPKQCESEAFTTLLNNYNAEYYNLPDSDFRDAINTFVNDKQIDLIITIPIKHGLFEGLFKKNYTKELAYHTHVPLMILHD